MRRADAPGGCAASRRADRRRNVMIDPMQ